MNKNYLIKKLRANSNWLFDDLVPLFESKLNNSLDVTFFIDPIHTPLWCRTAIRYNILKGKDFDGIDTLNNRFIDSNFKFYLQMLSVLGISSTKNILFSQDEIEKLTNVFIAMEKKVPLDYEQFSKCISTFILVDDNSFGAASHPHLWGLIFITKKLLACAEDDIIQSLIHEMGHQELFLINLVDRLVFQNGIANMVYAPFQRKERGPMGRLHSCHAIFRMLKIYSSGSIKHGYLNGIFYENIKTFELDALTPFGRKLINEVYVHSCSHVEPCC